MKIPFLLLQFAQRLTLWGQRYDNKTCYRKTQRADPLLDVVGIAVNPQVCSGERIGLVEHNGGGKSSWLRQLWRI
ncbi:MAG: hypothetical protein ACTIJQ_09355 [Alcaligenes sp.]